VSAPVTVGEASAALSFLAMRLEHLGRLTCALRVVAENAGDLLEDDNAADADAIVGIASQVDLVVHELAREAADMQRDPRWNHGARPLAAEPEGTP
jgi:hypothetical protein